LNSTLFESSLHFEVSKKKKLDLVKALSLYFRNLFSQKPSFQKLFAKSDAWKTAVEAKQP
jgi:hypothetical protein